MPGSVPTLLQILQQHVSAGIPKDISETAARTRELRDALSIPRTDDNIAAASRIDLSRSQSDATLVFGPVVQPSNAPISSLIWALEDGETIPEQVRNAWPEVTLAEWQAALRFVVRLLSATEL
jgi:hypothetical protein